MITFFTKAICRIPGATAYGLTKEDTLTNSRLAFLNFISIFPSDIPLICVGGVDCTFLIWKREIEPKAAVRISVDHLFSFLKDTGRKFIITSVILPPNDTLSDRRFSWNKATREQRTDIVKLFNIYLSQLSISEGHYFLDIATPTMGPDGFVDQKYVISPKDIHLAPIQIYDVVREKLDEAKSFCDNLK
jgi:hypothetical protein